MSYTLPFAKYHGLGNDYIVLEQRDMAEHAAERLAREICDRHYGVGSDGILVNESREDAAQRSEFALRIFNPDGSLAEKSGNGLRIFSRYLFDCGHVSDAPFLVHTPGGDVTCRVLDDGASVVVDMGRISFDSALIPMTGPRREALDERMTILGETLRYSACTLGNPHCVVMRDEVNAAEAQRLGPHIEHEPRFPKRTNVQFLRVLDRANIRIEIWERGAGYTLASGSSSCAAAAVARRLGLVDGQINVHVPGGVLKIELNDAYEARLTGPVAKVCGGVFYPIAGL